MERIIHYILVDHIPVALNTDTEENLLEWIRWMQDYNRLRVAEDVVGSFSVSTYFLGRDRDYPPRLFQTIICERTESTCLLIDDNVKLIDHVKSELDHLMWRYETWDQAALGHQKVVEMVRRSMFKGRKWWEFVMQAMKNKPVCR